MKHQSLGNKGYFIENGTRVGKLSFKHFWRNYKLQQNPFYDEKFFLWWRSYRWQLIIVMLIAAIINYIDRVNLSFAAIDIRQELLFSQSQMGFLLAAWMWPYAIANLPSGWLIDKIGINKIFIWSVSLWSIATIATGLTTSYESIYLSRLLLGIAEAPFFIIGAKVVQLYFSENMRGISSSIINMGPKIANGFAPPLIAFLIILTSWRSMFILLGIAGFFIVLLWIKIYKKNDAAFLIHHTSTTNIPNIKFSLWKLFNHKTTWWINLGNFGSSYVFWLYFTWLPTYLMDKRGLDLKATGWIAAMPFIAGVIAVPLGGYISDWLIRKHDFNVIKARVYPAVGGCIIAGCTVIPINYVDSLTAAVVLFSISTFSVSARAGVLWALVTDVAPRNVIGTFGGIQNFASFMGGALASTLSGIILQRTNNYNIVFWISGILAIAAAFCYAQINKPILATELIGNNHNTDECHSMP